MKCSMMSPTQRSCLAHQRRAGAAHGAPRRRCIRTASTAEPAVATTADAATSSKGAKAESFLHVPDWPNGIHSVHMEVRDTELDQFSVVNNNKYGEYMQHGRHKALHTAGMDVCGYQQRGILMALSELNIKYKTPLRTGDVFRVDTSVEQVTAARLVMRQAVVREDAGGRKLALCAEGLATVVFLDEAYRPIRLPAGDRAVFEALRQQAAVAAAGGGGGGSDGGGNGNGAK